MIKAFEEQEGKKKTEKKNQNMAIEKFIPQTKTYFKLKTFQNSHKLGQYAKFAQNQEIDTRAI